MDRSRAQQSSIAHVWKADDDWTEHQEVEERKKRQNRLNQRAHRRRNTQKLAVDRPDRPFRVDRFRLVDVPATRPRKVLDDTPTSASQGGESTLRKSALQMRLESLGRKGLGQMALPSTSLNNLALAPPITSISSKHEQVVIGEDLVISVPPLPTRIIEAGLTHQQLEAVNRFTRDFDLLTASPNVENATESQNPSFSFPLPSDHLLHLIHHNVFRALITNKLVISSATLMSRKDRGNGEIVPSFMDLCDGFTIIHPKPGRLLPGTLGPTYSQMTIGHSSWFNMFPHPRIRDNLILHEGKFDPYDFCNDIFGELTDPNRFTRTQSSGFIEETDDNITDGRKGLIVWGEPWEIEGWEVMPGFLRKWGWVLEGCEDLIAASNRWRSKRDEEPLPAIF